MNRGGGASGLVAAILLAMPVGAQPAPRIGAFGQAVASAGPGADGVALTHARLRATWAVRRTVELFVQAEFTDAPALRDAELVWRPMRAFTVEAGAFKPPFSRDFLTSRGDLLRPERLRIVQRLVPGRQVGVSASLTTPRSGPVVYAAVVNGNGIDPPRPDVGGPMGVGRLEQRIRLGGATVDLGANAVVSRDGAAELEERPGTFAGRRTVVGADARVVAGRLALLGEGLWASLRRPGEAEALRPWGAGATAAWRLRPGLHAVLAYDRVGGDTLATGHWGGLSIRTAIGTSFVLHAGADARLDARVPLVARLTAQVAIP